MTQAAVEREGDALEARAYEIFRRGAELDARERAPDTAPALERRAAREGRDEYRAASSSGAKGSAIGAAPGRSSGPLRTAWEKAPAKCSRAVSPRVSTDGT